MIQGLAAIAQTLSILSKKVVFDQNYRNQTWSLILKNDGQGDEA